MEMLRVVTPDTGGGRTRQGVHSTPSRAFGRWLAAERGCLRASSLSLAATEGSGLWSVDHSVTRFAALLMLAGEPSG